MEPIVGEKERVKYEVHRWIHVGQISSKALKCTIDSSVRFTLVLLVAAKPVRETESILQAGEAPNTEIN